MTEKEKQADATPYIGKLSTIIGVRKEMARVYRDSRRGDLKVNEGSKLVYMLKMVGELIKDGSLDELAERLEALENK